MSEKKHPFNIGQGYFIRTVTHYYTGRIAEVYDNEVVLRDAAWIPDTGRFANALSESLFEEVEPFPVGDVIIGRGSIIDAVAIKKLPTRQK